MANTHAPSHDAHAQNGHDAVPAHPDYFEVRILRQDGPGMPSYWERHRVAWEPEMNVTSVLQRIAAQATTVDGKRVAPVAWDSNCLEEVCGACTMVINGHVRQGCSALVNRLLQDRPGEIELQPMQKFPVLRDLCVDRRRLFRALEKISGWIPADGYYDQGPGPKMSPAVQETRYPYSECMSCGCCLDACPQYLKIELERLEGESDEAYARRKDAAYDRGFAGAHAIGQVVLFNLHPTGNNNAGERLDAMMSEGGIQDCGNAQNCVAVCPKHIPLTTAIAQVGRATTVRMIKRWFGE